MPKKRPASSKADPSPEMAGAQVAGPNLGGVFDGPGPVRGRRDTKADLAALDAALVVAEAWRAKALARNLADLKGIIAHEAANPGGRPVVPGVAVAIAKVAPWEADPSLAPLAPEAAFRVGLLPSKGLGSWGLAYIEEIDGTPLEILTAQSPQASHVDRARAWLELLNGAWFLREEEEPAEVMQQHLEGSRDVSWWVPDAEVEEVLNREHERDRAARQHLGTLLGLRGQLGDDFSEAAEVHRLRKAADDGGFSGPRFKAEHARALRDALGGLGLLKAWALTRPGRRSSFWDGDLLALSWPFLGLELRLNAEDLHAALLGSDPLAVSQLVVHQQREAISEAIAAALSAHGVLRGPCERCAYPAWLVPYRGPKARGPAPLSHRLCATCETLNLREKAVARVQRSRAKAI